MLFIWNSLEWPERTELMFTSCLRVFAKEYLFFLRCELLSNDYIIIESNLEFM